MGSVSILKTTKGTGSKLGFTTKSKVKFNSEVVKNHSKVKFGSKMLHKQVAGKSKFSQMINVSKYSQ